MTEKGALPTVLVRSAAEVAALPEHEKTVSGRSVSLRSGGAVWLQDGLTESGGNHLMFTNAAGTQTHICISSAAMEAVVELWESRGIPIHQWQVAIQSGDRTNDNSDSTPA